jgi:hypothetical protein
VSKGVRQLGGLLLIFVSLLLTFVGSLPTFVVGALLRQRGANPVTTLERAPPASGAGAATPPLSRLHGVEGSLFVAYPCPSPAFLLPPPLWLEGDEK